MIASEDSTLRVTSRAQLNAGSDNIIDLGEEILPPRQTDDTLGERHPPADSSTSTPQETRTESQPECRPRNQMRTEEREPSLIVVHSQQDLEQGNDEFPVPSREHIRSTRV